MTDLVTRQKGNKLFHEALIAENTMTPDCYYRSKNPMVRDPFFIKQNKERSFESSKDFDFSKLLR